MGKPWMARPWQPTRRRGRTRPTARGPLTSKSCYREAANPEQIDIAERLERHGCVLVQGPPGTGKPTRLPILSGTCRRREECARDEPHHKSAQGPARSRGGPAAATVRFRFSRATSTAGANLESAVIAITERLSRSQPSRLHAEATPTQRAAARAWRDDRSRPRRAPRRPRGRISRDRRRRSQLGAERGRAPGGPRARTPRLDSRPRGAGRSARALRGGAARVSSTTNSQLSAAIEDELALDLPNPNDLISPHALNALLARRAVLESELKTNPGRSELWDSKESPADSKALQALAAALPRGRGGDRAGG